MNGTHVGEAALTSQADKTADANSRQYCVVPHTTSGNITIRQSTAQAVANHRSVMLFRRKAYKFSLICSYLCCMFNMRQYCREMGNNACAKATLDQPM